MRPRLLDLFCGAGGAAMGYHRAGFEVVGVDINPQPNYPFEFHQGDALDVQNWPRRPFSAVHASPPCQAYSAMGNVARSRGYTYPDLIPPTRDLLEDLGLPWVIENVPRAPLVRPVMLCGTMFGLDMMRHRWFESSWAIATLTCSHSKRGSRAGHWRPGTYISVAGNCAPIALARKAMGIDWTTRDELREAIPPAFTEWIGRQLLEVLEVSPRPRTGA